MIVIFYYSLQILLFKILMKERKNEGAFRRNIIYLELYIKIHGEELEDISKNGLFEVY